MTSMKPALPVHSETAARGCGRCERLPERQVGEGVLYLWFPLGHTASKALAALRAEGHALALLPESECASVRVRDGDRSRVIACLCAALTRGECHATRALLVAGDGPPTLADYRHAKTLAGLSAIDRAGWLLAMLAEQRFSSWYQPIVDLRDTRVIYAQEALLRGREPDGAVVYPGAIFEAANEADLLFQVDLAARLAAIRGARGLPASQSLFVNFTPAAIYDPENCLKRTVAAVDEAGLAHERVVFEVVESGEVRDPKHLRGVLDYYRGQGFRVALDDVGAGSSSLNLIHLLRPDLIKIDMGLVRDVHRDPYKAVIAAKLLEIAAALDIPTVAEGIEDAEELRWVRAHGARYAQGYCLARPSPSLDASTPLIA